MSPVVMASCKLVKLPAEIEMERECEAGGMCPFAACAVALPLIGCMHACTAALLSMLLPNQAGIYFACERAESLLLVL